MRIITIRVRTTNTRMHPMRAPVVKVASLGVYATSLLAVPGVQAETATSDSADSDASGNKLEQVVVKGVRPLIDEKLAGSTQNIPQSVTVVSSELMSAQASTRLEDALKNVPGITLNAGEGSARGDTVNLRGFSAFNDFFLDGIRDAAVYTRDSFDLESVEVVKGPSAILFGRGSTGGAINQVSKAPLLTQFGQVDTEFGSNDLYRATADMNAPIGTAAAARINVMGESSTTAEREDVRNRRWGVAPALGFGIGERDSFTLVYLHQQEDDVPDVGIPFVNGRPAQVPPVPRNADFGLTSDRTTADDDIITGRYTHEFNAQLSVSDTLRYANYQFDYQFDAPNFGASPPGAGEPLGRTLAGRDAPGSSSLHTHP